MLTATKEKIDVERSVLGDLTLATDEQFGAMVALGLNAGMFTHDGHRIVYQAMERLREAGASTNVLTVRDAIGSELLGSFGGDEFLRDILESATHAIHLEYHVEILKKQSWKASKAERLKQALRRLEDSTCTVEEIQTELSEIVDEPTHTRTSCFADSLVSHAEFMARETFETYLIEGMMVVGHNLCLAGPPKLGKTMLLADAAVSLGSGTPFLGHFDAPEAVPVLMLSGESGEKTLRRYCKVIQEQRGIDSNGVQITWGMQLPALSNPKDLRALERIIQKHGFRVVVIDPIYLALLKGGGSKTDTHRLGEMGVLLGSISDIGQRTDATIVVCHHANKSLASGSVMGLGDMNGSGFDAWARSWILGNRRSAYRNDFQHELVLNIGGSAGHSGLYDVTLDESTWEVSVERRGSLTSQAKQDDSERFVCELERLQTVINSHPEGETLTTLRGQANIDNHDIRDRLDVLLKQGAVEECEFRRGGKGRTLNGYRPAKATEQ